MLVFDWGNVFLLLVITLLIMFALRTDNGGMRVTAHIVVFVTLLGIVQPLFALLYGGFMGYHVMAVED